MSGGDDDDRTRRPKRVAESELVALKKKKARIEASLAVLKSRMGSVKAEIEDFELEEKDARAVTVSWRVFEIAAEHSRKAWIEHNVGDDVYHAHRECGTSDTCWYAGNMDRLDELVAIYTLEPLHGVTAEMTLCDKCIEHARERERVIEDACPVRRPFGRPAPHYEEQMAALRVRVDPDDYEPDIAAFLRRSAAGQDTEDMNLKWYS